MRTSIRTLAAAAAVSVALAACNADDTDDTPDVEDVEDVEADGTDEDVEADGTDEVDESDEADEAAAGYIYLDEFGEYSFTYEDIGIEPDANILAPDDAEMQEVREYGDGTIESRLYVSDDFDMDAYFDALTDDLAEQGWEPIREDFGVLGFAQDAEAEDLDDGLGVRMVTEDGDTLLIVLQETTVGMVNNM